jgi:hypothetical protein
MTSEAAQIVNTCDGQHCRVASAAAKIN